MYLEYGINKHGELIYVDQARRGLNELSCPYCGGQLLAKKGGIISHHFAHAGETCLQVNKRKNDLFQIPYYDKFDLHLTSDHLMWLYEHHYTNLWMNDKSGSPNKDKFYQLREEIRKQDETLHPKYHLRIFGGRERSITDSLQRNEFIKWNQWNGRTGDWELSKRGKVPVGAASLQTFAEIQLEHIQARHEQLSAKLQHWQGYKYHYSYAPPMSDEEINNHLADLNIYRAQLRRVFSASLYFLEIEHSGGLLYKVGMSNRTIEERVEEIQRDLAPHLTGVKVSILRRVKHRGSVEFYFKHRYRFEQERLGSLTEYFAFADRKAVLADISKLKDYAPDEFMQAIIDGKPSPIEVEITSAKEALYKEEIEKAQKEARKEAIRLGMKQAAEKGIHLGRPLDDKEDIISKYPQVIELLQTGTAIRDIARQTSISKNTVKRVRDAYRGEDSHE